MNIDNLKEVQLRNNKMISKGHFKDKCSWLSSSHSSAEDRIAPKEIESPCRSKEEYLELLSREIELLFISREFTKKEKKHIYELTTEAFWEWKIRAQKK